jgi:hypothetical protein
LTKHCARCLCDVEQREPSGKLPPEVKDWLKSGEHLPEFLRDFHDAKRFGKHICFNWQKAIEGEMFYVNWIDGIVYVIDVFLWTMAAYGYTMQKTRKKLPFLKNNWRDKLEELF